TSYWPEPNEPSPSGASALREGPTTALNCAGTWAKQWRSATCPVTTAPSRSSATAPTSAPPRPRTSSTRLKPSACCGGGRKRPDGWLTASAPQLGDDGRRTKC